MASHLTRNWWVLLLRGIAAIIFGIMAIMWPFTAFTVVIIFYGAFALVSGIFALMAAIGGVHPGIPTWALVAQGLAGIAIGLITFIAPGVALFAGLYLIAFWEIETGVVSIVAAIQLRKVMRGEFLMILSGIISIIFGLVIAFRPGIGFELVGLLIAIYALFHGVTLVTLAFEIKNWHHDMPAAPAP